MTVKPTILSTRTLSKQIVNQGAFEALSILSEDYIGIQSVSYEINEVNQIVLFTSQNAVKSILKQEGLEVLKQKPAVCVGVKTKDLLERNGWKVLFWTHYAKELAPIIVEQFKDKTITFFSGSIRRDTLPDAFKQNGIVYNEFTVYQTVLVPLKNTYKVDGLCFYSPSAIESYLQKNSITDEVCFCIGETTAEALNGITQHIVLAQEPTIEATLLACVDYYK